MQAHNYVCMYVCQGRPTRSSVLLLQLVLCCRIVSLQQSVLKFSLARLPLLLAFLSYFFFPGAFRTGVRLWLVLTARCAIYKYVNRIECMHAYNVSI